MVAVKRARYFQWFAPITALAALGAAGSDVDDHPFSSTMTAEKGFHPKTFISWQCIQTGDPRGTRYTSKSSFASDSIRNSYFYSAFSHNGRDLGRRAHEQAQRRTSSPCADCPLGSLYSARCRLPFSQSRVAARDRRSDQGKGMLPRVGFHSLTHLQKFHLPEFLARLLFNLVLDVVW